MSSPAAAPETETGSTSTTTTTTTTATTPQKLTPTITQRNQPSELSACAETLNVAFVDDPVLRYTLSRNTSQPSKSDSLITNPFVTSLLFESVVTAGQTANGTVSTIAPATASPSPSPSSPPPPPYPSVGIFLPPGRDPNHPSNYIYQLGRIARLLFHCGFAVSWRIVASFPAQVKEMKSAVFTPQQVAELDFYYVFFLGTRPEAQGQGLASAWLRQCQAEAARAGKPIWLESSTVRSRDLYAHLGWRVVAEQVFGKGLVDAQGRPVEGGRGEGATLWGMIWWPEGLDPSAKKKMGSGGGKNDSDAK